MTPVPIGIVGRIVSSGERCGWYVKVQGDSENSGGFLILEWSENPRIGFDSWVNTRGDVDRFFEESGWQVDWLNFRGS
jgi:hypothetical protein